MPGYFDNGNPYIEIEVRGAFPDTKNTLKGMVDTGFNGYLTLPYEQAFPLALVLIGTSSARIADGSVVHNFVCIGTVTIHKKSIAIPISIQPDCTILIGTQLMKKAGLCASFDFVSEEVIIKASNNTDQQKISN